MCSSVSTLPDDSYIGIGRNRRANSFAMLDRQISEIIRGQRQETMKNIKMMTLFRFFVYYNI